MRIELAGGVVTDSDQRILLIHRRTRELTQWELPGGEVERVVTTPEAVARELNEELGVTVEVGRELGEQNFSQDGLDYSYKWLAAKILLGGRPYPQERKHDDCGYFSLSQLRIKDDLSPNMHNLLKKLIDGEFRL